MEATEQRTITIAIIDDEEIIRYSLQRKLARLGYSIISLERAEDMLYLIKTEGREVDLVITDIKLHKMDGIELLRHISALENPVPVLIITGQGNMEDAITALRYGACDFIRKPFDINEVASVVRSILRRKQEKLLAGSSGRFIEYEKRVYRIPVDATMGNVLSYIMTKNLPAVGMCNTTTAENISLALSEAISNAMYHGNLQIPSNLREEQGLKGYNEEIEARKNDPQYRDKRVLVEYELTKDYVEYFIEDEGNGFDYRNLPDPRDPDNFLKDSGRGLLIIRIHFDEVAWNDKGNRIRLKKYRTPRDGEG
jgi:DNA-binding response OmpR family regulator